MEINKLTESIASALKTEAGEFSEAIIKEGEEVTGIDYDKLSGVLQKVVKNRIDSVAKESRDEGYGRAKKETMEQIEARLAEKYSVEKTRFEDMMETIVSKQRESFQANPKDIENSDVYLNAIKAEQKKAEQLRNEFEQEKQSWKKQQVQLLGQSRAKEYLNSANFALPEDQSKRENLVRLFLNDVFNNSETQIEPNGTSLKILDKEGYPVRNDMKEEITFDDFLEKKASLYFERKSDKKPASPNNHKDGSDGGEPKIDVPDFNSNEEYIRLVQSNIKDKKVVEALREKYEQKVKAGEIQA